MSGARYLLDTNVISEEGKEVPHSGVAEWLDGTDARREEGRSGASRDAFPSGAWERQGVGTRWRGGFRIFSFRWSQLAMPEDGAGGMKIPE